jgi:hypothetical protein
MNIRSLSEVKHGWTLFTVDFILPVPLTALMTYLWYQRTHNSLFTLYVILLPLLFGYVIPGIGTNVLKLWAFKWKFMRLGNYFIHHGFMYAPYFALALYCTFGNGLQFSIMGAITIVISNSFLQCFLTTWHDYWGLQSGMIEIYNKPFREGKGAADIILDYGPISYALFGATYAMACLAAYSFLTGTAANFLLLLFSGVGLMGLSGLHYIYREKKLKAS